MKAVIDSAADLLAQAARAAKVPSASSIALARAWEQL